MIERKQFGDVVALRLAWPRSQFAGYGVYVFVVRTVLVDSGFPGVARQFQQLVRDLRPRGAFITHHHEDHAGNVQMLAENGIPIAMDAVTASLLRQPAPIGAYRHLMWKASPPLTSTVPPFADQWLSLVPTPGHCSNHHSVWDESTGTLFGGDLFLGVKVRVAHATEHPRQHVQSLRAMAARQPARLFCAHRGFVQNAQRVLEAKADWMEALITRAEERMDAGVSDAAIRRELIGSLGTTHYISAGDYSPNNLIASIRKTRHEPVVMSPGATSADVLQGSASHPAIATRSEPHAHQ